MRLLLLLLQPAFGFLTELIDHHHHPKEEEVHVVGRHVKARRGLEGQHQGRDVVVKRSDLVRLTHRR
jgi:hypothetical protein